ncbi:type II toxin-antitoxin system VapC family toxin [Variovorax sp. PCZ-1]|uniref:type II toxin-antitoxin system VapC family toxin n=1 Tax=Variovorax sp. PCZ-1 TaxID=2835533 RepID=UPI001BCF1ADF|nr:type II toxin-antitoxin system VapC family toxin [Variovorax sp. PCZ-1]MBS7806300.1 type II toxin-antitoxin system VapC family toxin [Variovorax sp. PCZ-1]
MYLLDTNTLIYFFTQRGQVAQRLRSTPAHLIKLAAPSLFELEYGTAKSSRPDLQRQQINDVVKVYETLPLDHAAAKAAGLLRHTLESVGKPIGTVYQLIAGIALANKLTVVTHNTNEFSRVPGLQVEDWYA